MSKHSLNAQIVAGAVLGVGLGFWWQALGSTSPVTRQGVYVAGLIGGVFIDLLKMILVPLVFTSIAVGVANLRQHRQIHRVWIATLVFFVTSMGVAILLGPGAGYQIQAAQPGRKRVEVLAEVGLQLLQWRKQPGSTGLPRLLWQANSLRTPAVEGR